MSGGRILAALVALGGLIVWWGLFGGSDQDLRRGLDETDMAFENVTAALREAEPDLAFLRALPGLRLAVQEEHARLVGQLGSLRDEQVALANDTNLARRERLPRLRDVVTRTDSLLAHAESFRRRLAGRVAFMRDSSPLLSTAEKQRDALAALVAPSEESVAPDEALATRISQLAGTWADLRSKAKLVDRLTDQNPVQGIPMGSGVLSSLRSLIDEQRALLDAHGQP